MAHSARVTLFGHVCSMHSTSVFWLSAISLNWWLQLINDKCICALAFNRFVSFYFFFFFFFILYKIRLSITWPNSIQLFEMQSDSLQNTNRLSWKLLWHIEFWTKKKCICSTRECHFRFLANSRCKITISSHFDWITRQFATSHVHTHTRAYCIMAIVGMFSIRHTFFARHLVEPPSIDEP